MKKNIYISVFILLFTFKATTGFCTTHIIANSGFTFSPDSISAVVGDTINFTLPSFHSAVEVNQTTWLANGSTSNGGFQVPTGGGMTVVTQVKTYYYVCGIHFSMGMKGRIFVTSATGINTPAKAIQGLEVFPNPATSWVTIKADMHTGKENTVRIYNIIGNCMYQKENVSSIGYLNLSGLPSGVYFVEVKSDDMVLEKKLVISK